MSGAGNTQGGQLAELMAQARRAAGACAVGLRQLVRGEITTAEANRLAREANAAARAVDRELNALRKMVRKAGTK